MTGMIAYKTQMKNLPCGILAAQAEAEQTQLLSIEIMDGEPKGAQCSDITECFIRVIVKTEKGNQSGLYYTQNLEEDPKEALMKAAGNAKCALTATEEFFLSPEEACQVQNAQSVTDVSWKELKQCAQNVEKRLRMQNPGAQIQIRLIKTVRTREIVNSLNLDISCSTVCYEAEMEIAENENGIPYFNAYSCSSADMNTDYAAFFQKKIEKWRSFRLAKGSLQAGEYPAVLDCEVTANIFATAWQLFTGRNYLTGSTPYTGQLGKEVFSRNITIKNLPVISECGFQSVFDCEGTKTVPVCIAQNGVLRGLLHTQETAKKMNTAPGGTAGRKALLSGNIHTDIIPVPVNFKIEQGTSSVETLLQNMQNGIYVFESFDVFHSINVASGEFHIPCKGILIKDGKMTSVAEEITINGTIQQLLNDVEEVGNQIHVRPMDLLKSYTVAAPDLRIKNIKFTGTHN